MQQKQVDDADGSSQHGLLLTVTGGEASKFVGLLNAGFMIKIARGEPVKTFLCDRIGLDPSYFDERIQTLFLNNKPVDDPATAVVGDGSVLALSAAMPGLVGATFRKGGRYRWMRGSISHPDGCDTAPGKTGWVTLKLFNLIQKELGPFFLEAGLWLKRETIQAFFADQIGNLAGHILSAYWNGREMVPGVLAGIAWPDKPVYIRIVSDIPVQRR
jgi:hypothetical protein